MERGRFRREGAPPPLKSLPPFRTDESGIATMPSSERGIKGVRYYHQTGKSNQNKKSEKQFDINRAKVYNCGDYRSGNELS
jgi:hypothetical protein